MGYFWTRALKWCWFLGYKYVAVSQNKLKNKLWQNAKITLPKALKAQTWGWVTLMLISSRKLRSHWFISRCEIVMMGRGLWPWLQKYEHFYQRVSLLQPETSFVHFLWCQLLNLKCFFLLTRQHIKRKVRIPKRAAFGHTFLSQICYLDILLIPLNNWTNIHGFKELTV